MENLAAITCPNPQEAQVDGYLVYNSPSKATQYRFRPVDSVDSAANTRYRSERSCGKPNTCPYTKINQEPVRGPYQVVFKVNNADSQPVETAPILTEGHPGDNERQQVIHRFASRESWVFHSIHNFRTILVPLLRKAAQGYRKPLREHTRIECD